MNSRNQEVVLIAGVMVLSAVAFAMKVPQMSAFDLVFIGVAGLVAIDLRRSL